MSSHALIARVSGTLPAPGRGHVVVPRLGLVFPARLRFAAWVGIGAQLAAVAASSAWCLGDWLIYGQLAYAGRYRQAVQRTGLDYQTLRNYAWVAGRFELSRRRDSLSFGHHAEVAALPAAEQDYWLRTAEQASWPVMVLRRQVRASLAGRGQGTAALQLASPAARPGGNQRQGRPGVLRVRLPPGQLALCQKAASAEGMALPAWAAQALEHAARDCLGRRTDDAGHPASVAGTLR